ncbi:MAG: hypothetical protein M9920_09120 [Verrucomicrobiae bacterium]|nr:hypothetical protein [Verrucomicrobiae bacterium]
MTAPLALLCYEDILPGSQLVNRLQDQGYRVQTMSSAAELPAAAAGSGAMLLLLDLVSPQRNTDAAIRKLRSQAETAHLPIIAFADEAETELQTAAKAAGANLVTTDAAIVIHLEQLIEQALRVD